MRINVPKKCKLAQVPQICVVVAGRYSPLYVGGSNGVKMGCLRLLTLEQEKR